MDRSTRSKELIDKSNLVFLRFYLIYYFSILVGVFTQYIFSSNDGLMKKCAFAVTFIALTFQVVGYFALKNKAFYGTYSLIIGCVFFTLVNMFSTGSEVMLMFIPFCTIGILATYHSMIKFLYSVWIGNAFLRVILLVAKHDVVNLQFKNLLWICFVCIMFATALNMVDKLIGVYYSNVIEDLFCENKKQRKLFEQSRVDSTTDLLNRNAYNDYLEKYNDDKKSVCCVYIDVNGLHEYNNLFGHQAGDEMLSSVANSIKKCFRSQKQYRVGGDEFVVICENADFKDVLSELKKFRHEMKQKKIHVATGMEWRDEDMRIDDIIKAADTKMYQDKEQFYKDHEEERRASRYM